MRRLAQRMEKPGGDFFVNFYEMDGDRSMGAYRRSRDEADLAAAFAEDRAGMRRLYLIRVRPRPKFEDMGA